MGGGVGGGDSGRATLLRGYTLFLSISFYFLCLCFLFVCVPSMQLETCLVWKPGAWNDNITSKTLARISAH